MKKAGVNWPKGLPHYAQALNQDPKKELAWKSPFETYLAGSQVLQPKHTAHVPKNGMYKMRNMKT